MGRAISAIDFSQGYSAGFEVPAEVSQSIAGSNADQNMTIELWLRSNNIYQPSRVQAIVSRQPSYNSEDTPSNFRTDFAVLLQPNDNLNVFMGGGTRNGFSLNCGFDLFRDRAWHHLAIVILAPVGQFPPTQVGVFVDAKQVCIFGPAARFFGTRQHLFDQPIMFSHYLDYSNPETALSWDGEMDEIKIWSRHVFLISCYYLILMLLVDEPLGRALRRR